MEVGVSTLERMRCFSAMTVVSFGSEMSRRRSGMDVVKRTVIRRGVASTGADGSRREAICMSALLRIGEYHLLVSWVIAVYSELSCWACRYVAGKLYLLVE